MLCDYKKINLISCFILSYAFINVELTSLKYFKYITFFFYFGFFTGSLVEITHLSQDIEHDNHEI